MVTGVSLDAIGSSAQWAYRALLARRAPAGRGPSPHGGKHALCSGGSVGTGDIGIADHESLRGIAPQRVQRERARPDAPAAQALDQLHVTSLRAQMRDEMHAAVLQRDRELA